MKVSTIEIDIRDGYDPNEVKERTMAMGVSNP
jgi:hypothetical protein